MDKFQTKYLEALKQCKSTKEYNAVVDKIYEDGFNDGYQEGREDAEDKE